MERISFTELPKGMFERLRDIENFIDGSSVNPKLLKLVKLRVSQINGCAYCLDMHTKELKHLGETDLRLSLLMAWEESNCFDAREMATLRYAEALTQIDRYPLPDEIFNALEDHFNTTEISFLSLAITQINTWNRLMKAFRFEAGNYQVQQ